MDYCTLDDVLAASDAETLTGLTDDEGSGEINEDVVKAAIRQATEEIDARLYTFLASKPTTPEPLLTRIAVQLTLYYLFLRRNLTEARKDEYGNCQQLLRDLQSGKLRLQAAVLEPDIDVSPGAAFTRPDAIVTPFPTDFYVGRKTWLW